MLRAQSLAMVLALTLVLAASSAVMPIIPLRDMAPEHACFFLCDICLAGGPDQDLLHCANNVCGKIIPGAACGPVLDLGMMWLGHKCRDFGLVMDLMTSSMDQKKKH